MKTVDQILEEIEKRSKEALNNGEMVILIELVSLIGWIKEENL